MKKEFTCKFCGKKIIHNGDQYYSEQDVCEECGQEIMGGFYAKLRHALYDNFNAEEYEFIKYNVNMETIFDGLFD